MRGHCTMKSYQLYGLNWMHLLYERRFGGILADDMGLGKTCQVISLMCAIANDGQKHGEDTGNRPWPNLIVVPPRPWQTGRRNSKISHLTSTSRPTEAPSQNRDEIAEEIIENPEDHHVVLTTSHSARPTRGYRQPPCHSPRGSGV